MHTAAAHPPSVAGSRRVVRTTPAGRAVPPSAPRSALPGPAAPAPEAPAARPSTHLRGCCAVTARDESMPWIMRAGEAAARGVASHWSSPAWGARGVWHGVCAECGPVGGVRADRARPASWRRLRPARHAGGPAPRRAAPGSAPAPATRGAHTGPAPPAVKAAEAAAAVCHDVAVVGGVITCRPSWSCESRGVPTGWKGTRRGVACCSRRQPTNSSRAAVPAPPCKHSFMKKKQERFESAGTFRVHGLVT